MRAEYLLFDAVVFAPALLGSLIPRPGHLERLRALLLACAVVAVPFVVWDAAVVNRHWWFEPSRVFGARLFGLPLEEIGFFVAVPYASVFLWETAFWRGLPAARPRSARALSLAPALLAIVFGWRGHEYAAYALLAVALTILVDDAAGTRLFAQPKFWAFLGAVGALGLLFNGYLTARPVVLYREQYLLGPRLYTVPLEDFIYGTALAGAVAVVYQWRLRRLAAPSWLGRLIELKLGGYRQRFNAVDATRPERGAESKTVAVIGGGLAGLSSAALLAKRGFRVTLFERNAYLGGKLAGWRERLPSGLEAPIEHGFHAFFRHYYNLNAFLDSLGLRRAFTSVGRYAVVAREGTLYGFDGSDSTPVLNLLALARRGLYSLSEVALGPARKEMEAFLRYHPEQTFARYDDLPFSEFSERAQLPKTLKVIFTAFARAFFSHEKDLSTAELIKSFHYYYLSHDGGLVYDYLPGGYHAGLLAPLEAHLREQGVELRTSTPVERLERGDDGLRVDGRAFDHAIVATDLKATQALMASSPLLQTEAPAMAHRLEKMKCGSRYAVLRVWLDRPVHQRWPVFVSTERVGELDALSFIDRIDPELTTWSREHHGCVLELHSYAVTPGISAAEVRASLLEAMAHYLPELKGAAVVHEHLQLRDDFTAFHVGLDRIRPGVESGVKGLLFAGDWVKLPVPAMLMEAAHTSALFAVNALCRELSLREYAIDTVPRHGVLLSRPAAAPVVAAWV